MADWTSEASEYLDGYLKQISVLVRGQGGDANEVVAGLRDHISNEVESDGAATVSIDRLLQVLSDLGSPEEVASIDVASLNVSSSSTPSPPPPPPVASPPMPPTVPRKTKTVVVHRSALSCLLAIILAPMAGLVVLALIGIVASIAVPNLINARGQARIASCENNLKQLGISLKNIAEEQDGHLPTVDLNYVGVMFDIDDINPESLKDLEIFICPAGPNADRGITEDDDEYAFDHDYLFISHVITSVREGLGYLDAVAEAKRTDTPMWEPITLEDGTVLPRIDRRGNAVLSSQIPMVVERLGHHTLEPDGYNVLFLDGHVEYGLVDESDGYLWDSEFAEAIDRASQGL